MHRRTTTIRMQRLAAPLALCLTAAGCARARTAPPASAPFAPRAAAGARDPSALRPFTLDLAYTIRGQAAGGARHTLTRVDGGWRHVSDVRYGEPAFSTEHKEIAFRDDLTAIGEDVQVRGGSTVDITWRNTGAGMMMGTLRYPKRPERDTSLSVPAPAEAVFTMLDEHLLSVTPLAVGDTVRMPVLITNLLRDVRFVPVAVETLTVPAGTFETFRVEVLGYPGVSGESNVRQVWHLTTRTPHRVVRQELPALALVGEAVAIR
jgi:hypothetical protein